MLNIKKAKLEIWATMLVSLSLILLFCLSGYLYAQMPGDFPEGREFDPRPPDVPMRPRVPGEIGGQAAHPTAISENVELVGATGGEVYDVFVQGNYAYICAGGLVILNISAPSNPKKVGYVALPDLAYDVYVQDGVFARQEIIATQWRERYNGGKENNA